MKVSGSHTEQISAWSNAGFEGAERGVIEATVDKLSREGKHVINIIHGDKTMVAGDYKKNITFLWETDTEDPVYKALQEKETELKRLGREVGQQKNLLNSNNKRIAEIPGEIAKLNARIRTAEANELYTEKDMKKEDIVESFKGVFGGIGLFAFAIIGVILGCNRYVVEDGFLRFIFVVCGIVIAIFGIFLFFGCIVSLKKDPKTRKERMDRKNAKIIEEKRKLGLLKSQIVWLQDELEECKKNRSILLAELEKKEKAYEEFKKKS